MSLQIVNGKLVEVLSVKDWLGLGAYVESYFAEQDLENMLLHIDAMNDCKMNLAYIRIADTAACKEVIARAVNYAMKIGIECNGVTEEKAIELVGVENIAFLLNRDDQEKATPVVCETRYKLLKSKFPTIPVYSTGYKLKPDAQAVDPIASRSWSDIDAQQNYPTGQQKDILQHSVDLYESAKQVDAIHWSNPQCYFGYTATRPTEEEIEQMAWAALAKTKALLWYTFYNWDHKNNKVWFSILSEPTWLDAVKRVCHVAREHESLILHTDAVVTKTEDGYTFEWKSADDHLLVKTGKRTIITTTTEVYNEVTA